MVAVTSVVEDKLVESREDGDGDCINETVDVITGDGDNMPKEGDGVMKERNEITIEEDRGVEDGDDIIDKETATAGEDITMETVGGIAAILSEGDGVVTEVIRKAEEDIDPKSGW